MPTIAGICIFITIMTALSIPIIAIVLNRPEKHGKSNLKKLEDRINELEQKVNNQETEIQELSSNVDFATRLIEKN